MAKKEKAKTAAALAQERRGNNVKSPKKAIDAVNKQIRKIKDPVYRINRMLKSKQLSRKKRKELNETLSTYKMIIEEEVQSLREERADYKTLKRSFEKSKKAKNKLKREIAKIDKDLYKADEEGDYKAFQSLMYKKINRLQKLDEIKENAGYPVTKVDPSKHMIEDEIDDSGYSEDPANPYPIWSAIKKLDSDILSGKFLYFVIDGKRIKHIHENMIRSEAAAFWNTIQSRVSSTPYVLRFVNNKTKSVKYKSYY